MRNETPKTCELLAEELASATLQQLKGGAQPSISHYPHDLVTSTGWTVPYDGQDDDVAADDTP